MTRKILSSISINFTVQVITNGSSSPIIKRKSFNNIYTKAAESDLFVICNLLKNLLKGNVTNCEIVEHYALTDN